MQKHWPRHKDKFRKDEEKKREGMRGREREKERDRENESGRRLFRIEKVRKSKTRSSRDTM